MGNASDVHRTSIGSATGRSGQGRRLVEPGPACKAAFVSARRVGMSEAPPPVAPRRRATRPSVRDLIVEMILDEGLRGGDPMPPEGRIADALGVSRTSVREAVRALAATGIVEVRHGVGLFVRPFSLMPLVEGLHYALLDDLTELGHLIELRQSLEIGLAETILGRRDDAQMDAFAECLSAMRARAAAGRRFPDEDRNFHRILLQNIENPLYGRLTDTFWLVFNRACERRPALSDGEPARSLADHVAIVEALHLDAPQALIAALRAHYDLIADRVAAAGPKEKTREGEE